ncbi:MAG: hypothetical protein K0S37_4694, partial [Microbacterium sp.]|nr:hypothetical protein [Microbacterium sp.]
MSISVCGCSGRKTVCAVASLRLVRDMTTYERTAHRNGTSAPATVIVEMDLTNPDH